MSDTEDSSELLFFDTFSHETDTDINLDLVQFPSPVYITQVRIIPLGARVQADFPGGVRLGATNPSKFDIQFFVNDLHMPGASTFEHLGHLQYNQNDCIHLECSQERIPTDGLVLRGWYSTITLAVYGILTMNGPIASPPPPVSEPTDPEEILNIGVDGTSVSQDDNSKDEWKEPLSGDMLPLAHKVDYEREDLEYGLSRDHYNPSDDEREMRMRKTSNSSDRSASSRNRELSESNERDYLRSRSPEYSHRSRRKRSDRSRSDAEEPHKWPRTPPTSIDSPLRPRSPDNMEFTESEFHYKMKSRSYMRSNESLTMSHNARDAHTMDADDGGGTPGTPAEQYEMILSDDEIIGDDDSNTAVEQTAADEFEAELQAAAVAAEPAINQFDPLKMPVLKHDDGNQLVLYAKEIDNLKVLFKKFSIQTRSDSLDSFKDTNTTVEERENFVFLCEQFINQLVFLSQNYKRRNFVLSYFFQNDVRNLQQAFSIFQIALNFDCACLQHQPAVKTRHIKVGARLAELLGGQIDFVAYLIETQDFDTFAALFELYYTEYMALSIKLMLLKAIYAFLDTPKGRKCFLHSKLNWYQQIMESLQKTKLTRTKYALRAIVNKMHLNEALECIRETTTNLFVLINYQPLAAADLYKKLELAIGEVLEAFTTYSLQYQQPRRFLPVSKKFEIVTDAMAQRSFANSLRSYFGQHTFAESLLLLLSNSSELPKALILRTLDTLSALLQTYVGIDYIVDDCFQISQMIIATLLDLDELPSSKDEEKTANDEVVDAKAANGEEKTEPEKTQDGEVDTPTPEDVEVAVNLQNAADLTDIATSTSETIRTQISSASLESATPEKYAPLTKLQRLGVEMAYKLQTRYHLDAIVSIASSKEYDAIKLATHLHALYSQTCHPNGRKPTMDVIGMNNNLKIFLDLIKKEQLFQAQRQLASPGSKYKSPVLSYAVDLVDCCVRYCETLDYLIEHGGNILELAKSHETFEPSVSAVLQEMFVYLKPLEVLNVFIYDDITTLVEVITRSLEYITTFPGDIIMGLRILHYLAIPPTNGHILKSSADTKELKYRYVALQFFAADGLQTLMQIMEKIYTYFEQPGLHAPALVSVQGLHCCQIILPTIQILRTMLTYGIQCRDTEFKDLTAVDHLVKTYFLLHYYPANCQVNAEVELAKHEIIQTLLAYTQPNELDEESLHKSLWTQMIREVLKNIDGPSTFIPGLQILSELLPLPLPIPLPSIVDSIETQMQRLITARKLWSAHLHHQSAQITKMIETIAPTTFPTLSDLLIRVCIQLADLAPNMTLLISKSIMDLLVAEWSSANNTPTFHLGRLLHFFARLSCAASIKSSALSIWSGKLWEIFNTILSTQASNEQGFKCQIAVHRILESFFDSEISLISSKSKSTPELNLASALPPKDMIPRIVEALWTNLANVDVTHAVSALGVRNMVILTEHDITFYHLSTLLKQKSSEFQDWMQKIIALNESGSYNSNIESLILLLRSLTQIEDNFSADSTIPSRTLKLSALELAQLIGIQKNVELNLLERIRSIVERNSGRSASAHSSADEQQQKDEPKNIFLSDITKLISLVATVDAANSETSEEKITTPEPFLPQTESIVSQFLARPVFTIYDEVDENKLLTANTWLQPLSIDALSVEELDLQCERIPCDLAELSNICLSPETNLSNDCKRLLHLSASPQSNRERTPTANCFRTRRVEVEPSTGRPEKKIYITPGRGRGFPRAPPSRGDLFRSRPPNTSRPPSLHVDDFLALETCGAQPTGPTGYNKIPAIIRGNTRVGRSRGSRIATMAAYRKPKLMRTASPSTWNEGGSPHYRTATTEPHFGSSSAGVGAENHYTSNSHSPHFGRPRGRGTRIRSYMR